MREIFLVFLFLHVMGAIVAFGPTFAFPLIGAAGGREPMHADFASRIMETISRRLAIPLAIVQGATGIGLIWSSSIDLLQTHWLLLSILLYLILLGFAIFVQGAWVEELVERGRMPAGAATQGPDGPPPGGRPTGPPPGVREAVQRVQRGGVLLSVLIVAIVALMVVKPVF